MSDFGPAQLDALEDALEDLEHIGVPAEAGGPDVAQRLAEYREIMHWTRDAMPLVEVKPGLLDGVLEEARTVAPVALPSEPQAEPASWWKRLRGVFVIPVIAVAGSAALVLLLFVPMANEDAADSTIAARSEPAPASTPTAAAEAKADDGKPAGVLENGLADASVDELSRGRLRLEEGNADGRAAGIEAPVEELPAAPPAVEAEPEPKASASAEKVPPRKPAKAKPSDSDKVIYDDTRQASGGGAAPAKEQAEAPAPGGGSTPREDSGADAPDQDAQKKKGKDDAGDPWGTIATADRLRRAGNCAAAKPKYKSLASAIDRRVKARALAGLGLCEKDAAANDYFDKARKADPDIVGFISHERGDDEPRNADQAQSAE